MTPPAEAAAACPPDERQVTRVCLASLNFYPVYAGPAIRFGRYLPGLTAGGSEVRVLSGTPDRGRAEASGMEEGAERRPGELLDPVHLGEVRVDRVQLPDDGPLRRHYVFSRALARFCARQRPRPDVIQLLSYEAPWVPAMLRLRRLGIPTVYTATMLPDLRQVPPAKRALLRRWLAFPTRLLDRIVVSSGRMREGLRDLGVRTPIEVIPNGVDVERFHPPRSAAERADARRELGIPPEDEVVLFVGPMVPRKGVDLIVEAWNRSRARHAGCHLVLVGPRLDESKPQHHLFHRRLTRAVEASPAPERIHMPGLVGDVERYMRAADVFAFASRREGMPNVVPEAMASGLPVLMTPFVGLPAEFGRAGHHYMMVERDAGAMGAALDRLGDDEGLRRTLGDEGRSWVEHTMPMEAIIERYGELYRRLGNRGTAAGRTGA